MKQRCYNPKNSKYANYGGRGIIVCERWLNNFNNFYRDMGDRPFSSYSLDRINNDGNYSPDNCRWVSARQQANNRRDNKYNLNKTHCPQDHEYTGDNLRISNLGYRQCIACVKQTLRNSYRRRHGLPIRDFRV